MRTAARTTALLALAGAALTGCAEAPEPRAERQTVGSERSEAAQRATLPPGVIQQLRAQYPVLGETPVPEPQPSADANPGQVPERLRERLSRRVLETVRGEASFYADQFEGRRTASGIPFRQNQMVAAHRAYPFGTLLRVTNLRNDRSVHVRVVDRGPFGSKAQARNTVLDLSRRAASELDYVGAGRTPVHVEVLEWGEGLPQSG